MQRIAILGGGPGGLMTAYQLGQRCGGGYQATIFESSQRIGGKLATRIFRSAPVRYESGAAECYDYRTIGPDPLHDLVDELGLNTLPMRDHGVCVDGRRVYHDEDLEKHWGSVPGYVSRYAIDGGMSALAEELTDRLPQTGLELGAHVRRVDKTPCGSYLIGCEQEGRLCQLEFDTVVVAMPIGHLKNVEWGDERLRRTLARYVVHYDRPGHYLRVSLLFSGTFWRDLLRGAWFRIDDFGGACVYDESRRFDTGHYGALSFLLAGDAALKVGNLEQPDILRRVIAALPPTLQRRAWSQLLQIVVHRWSGAVSGQPGGVPSRNPRASQQPDPQSNPALMLVGDYLFDSTLNGVLQSANVTTELIAERLEMRSCAA